MIKTAKRYIPEEIQIDITNISLLTIDEAKALPEEVRAYSTWWWLRSSGYGSNYATYVDYDGSVSDYGYNVRNAYIGVRPALTISNLESLGLNFGDLIEIQDKKYIVISKDKVLYNDEDVRHRFNGAKNNYSGSEIEGIVKGWLQEDE